MKVTPAGAAKFWHHIVLPLALYAYDTERFWYHYTIITIVIIIIHLDRKSS